MNWGEVAPPGPAWAPGHGRLWAVWPSPVDHDACFAAAGFTDFADTDAAWDAEFDGMLARGLAALSDLGDAALVAGEYPTERGQPRVSLRDALLAAARDDNFPPCVVAFGEPALASMRTSHGHPIVWVWKATGSVGGLVGRMADGRDVGRCDLDWDRLL